MTRPNDVHGYEWTSRRKMLFHMDQSDDAQRRLFQAVVQGEVRTTPPSHCLLILNCR
jgi:hypothetical protein